MLCKYGHAAFVNNSAMYKKDTNKNVFVWWVSYDHWCIFKGANPLEIQAKYIVGHGSWYHGHVVECFLETYANVHRYNINIFGDSPPSSSLFVLGHRHNGNTETKYKYKHI